MHGDDIMVEPQPLRDGPSNDYIIVSLTTEGERSQAPLMGCRQGGQDDATVESSRELDARIRCGRETIVHRDPDRFRTRIRGRDGRFRRPGDFEVSARQPGCRTPGQALDATKYRAPAYRVSHECHGTPSDVVQFAVGHRAKDERGCGDRRPLLGPHHVNVLQPDRVRLDLDAVGM